MDRRTQSVLRVMLCFTLVLQQAVPAFAWPKLFGEKTCQPALVMVSEKIDCLEKQLNKDGTVIIKAPDIWGESRLTKHRQEFERKLAAEIDGFKLLLNASIRRSDQAYLANALAIQAALLGENQSQRPGIPGASADPTKNEISNVFAFTQSQMENATNPDGTAKPLAAITRTDVGTLGNNQTGVGFTEFAAGGVALEPTIHLDQLKRYLDHLHQIRRVNEGDDTADAPGYSLNLVRIPVSIMPGEQTRAGYGAEVTVSAKPHISPELLPRVFRELVINDLIDQLALPIVKVAEELERLHTKVPDGTRTCEGFRHYQHRFQDFTEKEQLELLELIEKTGDDYDPNLYKRGRVNLEETYNQENGETGDVNSNINNNSSNQISSISYNAMAPFTTKTLIDTNFIESIQSAIAQASSGVINNSITRNSRQPLAPSQVTKVFGTETILRLGYEFWKTTQYHNTRHLMDAQGFLKEQLEASYDFLTTNEGMNYWDNIYQIHQQVRQDTLDYSKIYFNEAGNICECGDVNRSEKHCETKCKPGPAQIPGPLFAMPRCISNESNRLNATPVTMGAWWILVEAALLNQRLNDDLQRVSQDPECFCHTEASYAFYHPCAPEEAKLAFIDYVNCRWPIHVFALDPVTQQQNIADTFSMRREMQLSLAMAFAAGNINAQNMMRFARRLELDMETVALNHTVAAFGHGDDTFGWRFMPRVQTPPFESNTKVVFRDLVWGGPSKDALRKNWEIEPGMRECVAIVLMPSFIEHLTFYSRGNYFKMSEYDKVKSTMVENAEWSQNIREMEMLLEQLHCEADLYRHGEIERVNHRVEQLAKKLPMQTVHARVPNENTLGGFEMFSAGISDLGPELFGYYGTPGIDPHRETLIYLVGNHFSVHETKVLAGNRNCEFSLLSRQVMEVKVPAGVQVVKDKFSEYPTCPDTFVDVHVATPYGVARRLKVPVVKDNSAGKSSGGYRWKANSLTVELYITPKFDPMGKFEQYLAEVKSISDIDQTIQIEVLSTNLLKSTHTFKVAAYLADTDVLVKYLDFSTGGITTFNELPLNVEQAAFVLPSTQYVDFLTKIVARTKTHLDSRYPGGTIDFSKDLKIILKGDVADDYKTPVNGELEITIELKEKSSN